MRNGRSGKARYARAIDILGPCKIVQNYDKPLPCGAVVYIETESEVKLYDECVDEELPDRSSKQVPEPVINQEGNILHSVLDSNSSEES
jgi:hypothetical protein